MENKTSGYQSGEGSKEGQDRGMGYGVKRYKLLCIK